jgi:hypothetical protein
VYNKRKLITISYSDTRDLVSQQTQHPLEEKDHVLDSYYFALFCIVLPSKADFDVKLRIIYLGRLLNAGPLRVILYGTWYFYAMYVLILRSA